MMDQTVFFGPEGQLVGTLSLPSTFGGRAKPLVALLSNSGVIGRAGPNRLNVLLARQFAAMGIPSFRFDMSGLGDSGNSRSSARAAERWVADTRAAMDFVAGKVGPCDFFMVGLCSGADIAYLTALEDPRLVGAALWDLYSYPTPRSKVLAVIYRLSRSGFAGIWRSMRRNLRLDDRAAANDVAKPRATEGAGFYGRAEVPTKSEFVEKMNRLVRRGFKPYFLYSGSAPEDFNYAGQFRDMFHGEEFWRRSYYDFVAQNDHLFSQPHMRERMREKLEYWVRKELL